MGVINITPDSFSDGGQYNQKEAFTLRLKVLGERVDMIDIGAQSTAPKSQAISETDEIQRFTPFISLLAEHFPHGKILSIDTYRFETFMSVYQELKPKRPDIIFWWNDVCGKIEEAWLDKFLQNTSAIYVQGHTLVPIREQTPEHLKFSWQKDNQELIHHLQEHFQKGKKIFEDRGAGERIIFDPCFGFSKNREQNLFLLKALPKLVTFFPETQEWLLGISRKSFLRPPDLKGEELIFYTEVLQTLILKGWVEKLPKNKLIFRVHNELALNPLRAYQCNLIPQ